MAAIPQVEERCFNFLSRQRSASSESNNTTQLHHWAPLISLGLKGDSRQAIGPPSIKVSKKTFPVCVCVCVSSHKRERGNATAATIIYLQDIPLGQILNTPHLIALWVVEPILLLFQQGSRIRSIKVMQHRRRTVCELFSGGRFEIFWILQQP